MLSIIIVSNFAFKIFVDILLVESEISNEEEKVRIFHIKPN